MKTVLFVCVGNAARSIIAEALFNSMAPAGWTAISGGTSPASRISEDAVSVLKEMGVKVDKEKPTLLDEQLAKSAEVGITMGCGVKADCAVLFTPIKGDWRTDDPRGQPIEEYRRILDGTKRKVEELVGRINNGGIK